MKKISHRSKWSGSRLKKARINKGLSQKQLADILLLSERTIINYEQNKQFPDINILIKLSEILDVFISWLAAGEKEKIIKEGKEIIIPEYPIEATVPAGIGEMYDRTDWLEFKELSYEPKENYFWIIVDKEFGTSMLPSIRPGDSVLISIKERIKNGDLVAARWGKSNAAIKIYHEENGIIYLGSHNPYIEPILLPKNKVTVFKVKLIEKK